ncbi:MAG: class I SAM-dependent methyltransferase [Patescibacteria group bacterium]
MPTDPKTVESYDTNAEAWALGSRSGRRNGSSLLERPAMHEMLPDLKGKEVLLVGCGSGEEAGEIARRGAARIVGTDISAGLIEEAKKAYPAHEFLVMDMEKLDFPKASFDFAYASLALHYLPNWRHTLIGVRRLLRPGGSFLFSVNHPVYWSAEASKEEGDRHRLLGYTKRKDGTVVPYGDYLGVVKLEGTLQNTLKATYWSRPFADMLRDIRDAGFEIIDMQEPRAIYEAKEKDPAFWAGHQKIPLFVLFHVAPRT